MVDKTNRIDSRDVRESFNRAAGVYDQAALLQREIADRMLERLDYVRLQPLHVLDVGAGTGYCAARLMQRYPRARVHQLDFAFNMLCQARQRSGLWQRLRKKTSFVCAEAASLPYADASMDMLVSNLTLQWCDDLPAVFTEFRRVLRPGGLLMFTSFGPDTLRELRAAWSSVDSYVHVNSFEDMHVIGDHLLRTPFADPVMDAEIITVTYRDVFALMKDLKQLGAHNVNSDRSHGLTGKSGLRKMQQAYETFRQNDVLPATHEVIYGHAWVGEGHADELDESRFAGIPVRPG